MQEKTVHLGDGFSSMFLSTKILILEFGYCIISILKKLFGGTEFEYGFDQNTHVFQVLHLTLVKTNR